jgi:hypothetical protein
MLLLFESHMLASHIATLVRTVFITGTSSLTNHRLLFSAILPSFQSGKLLKSGPATLHRPGLLTKRRGWVELRSDSAGSSSTGLHCSPLSD